MAALDHSIFLKSDTFSSAKYNYVQHAGNEIYLLELDKKMLKLQYSCYLADSFNLNVLFYNKS